jgi:hypothetical protein
MSDKLMRDYQRRFRHAQRDEEPFELGPSCHRERAEFFNNDQRGKEPSELQHTV